MVIVELDAAGGNFTQFISLATGVEAVQSKFTAIVLTNGVDILSLIGQAHQIGIVVGNGNSLISVAVYQNLVVIPALIIGSGKPVRRNRKIKRAHFISQMDTFGFFYVV